MIKLPACIKNWFLEKPILNDLISTRPVNHGQNYLAIKGYIRKETGKDDRRMAAFFHFNPKNPHKKRIITAHQEDVCIASHKWDIFHVY